MIERVLLVSVNRSTAPFPVYPLGLDHVAAALAPAYAVRVLDLLVSGPEAIGPMLRDFTPDLVGISIRNIDNSEAGHCQSFVDDARQAVALVRQTSRAPVVLGGAGYSLFPEVLLEVCAADYGIVGDGEQLLGLLEALGRGLDPGECPGVVVRGRPFTAVRASFPPPRSPVFSGSHLAYYLERGGMLNLESARGCPFACHYCTYPLIQGRRLRTLDPSEVARTARALEARGARFLFMTDSVFNADPGHSLAVARALRTEQVTLPWAAFFSCLPVPPGYYEELRAAGLSHVEFGTESLSDPVLRGLGKPFTADDVLTAHDDAVRAGTHVAHYLMLGGPGETIDTVHETLDRAGALEQAVLFFFCGVRVYPGTELEALSLREGRLRPGDPLLEPVFYRPAFLSPERIQALVEERRRGRLDWVIGSGNPVTVARMERKRTAGKVGPLWEELLVLERIRQQLSR
jgi:radical SAM superfamily enzyme YgiQ (UPF0313 family)